MDNTAPSSSKRRKTSSPDNANSTLCTLCTLCLANMPHDHLTAIADYLPKSSRALFAVALTAPSKSFRTSNWKGKLSEASKAIIASTTSITCSSRRRVKKILNESMAEYYATGWNVLDFDRDIDEYLSRKLKDDDIGAILVCIDAKNKLKTLQLNCKNIVGYGLEPMRGSSVLECIQFNSSPLGKLSAKTIVPILDSIIDTEGSSLFKSVLPRKERPLRLPNNWTNGPARHKQPLNDFLSKVNQIIISESKCNSYDHNEETNTDNGDENAGHMACFTCFTSYCSQCNGGDGYPILKCDNCDVTICTGCEENFAVCRVCNSRFCSVCSDKEDVDAAKQCEQCMGYSDPICFGCVTSANEECKTCLGLFFSKLKARNEELGNEIGGLCEENDTHKAEIEKLRKEIEDLRLENDELRLRNDDLSSGLGILG